MYGVCVGGVQLETKVMRNIGNLLNVRAPSSGNDKKSAQIGSACYLDFFKSPAHLHAQVDAYNWHIIMDQGYGNLAWECVRSDDARLVKVKQLLMS